MSMSLVWVLMSIRTRVLPSSRQTFFTVTFGAAARAGAAVAGVPVAMSMITAAAAADGAVWVARMVGAPSSRVRLESPESRPAAEPVGMVQGDHFRGAVAALTR